MSRVTFKPRLYKPKNIVELRNLLQMIGSDEYGIRKMTGKGLHRCIYLSGVPIKAALLLKQEMLSKGGDAAVSRDVASLKCEKTDVLLMGTYRQYEKVASTLALQPFGLKGLAVELRHILNNLSRDDAEAKRIASKINNMLPREMSAAFVESCPRVGEANAGFVWLSADRCPETWLHSRIVYDPAADADNRGGILGKTPLPGGIELMLRPDAPGSCFEVSAAIDCLYGKVERSLAQGISDEHIWLNPLPSATNMPDMLKKLDLTALLEAVAAMGYKEALDAHVLTWGMSRYLPHSENHSALEAGIASMAFNAGFRLVRMEDPDAISAIGALFC